MVITQNTKYMPLSKKISGFSRLYRLPKQIFNVKFNVKLMGKQNIDIKVGLVIL